MIYEAFSLMNEIELNIEDTVDQDAAWKLNRFPGRAKMMSINNYKPELIFTY